MGGATIAPAGSALVKPRRRVQSPLHRQARALGALRPQDLMPHARSCGDAPAPQDLHLTRLDGSCELLRWPGDLQRQRALDDAAR